MIRRLPCHPFAINRSRQFDPHVRDLHHRRDTIFKWDAGVQFAFGPAEVMNFDHDGLSLGGVFAPAPENRFQ